MEITTIVGSLAMLFAVTLDIPQIWKMIKTSSVEGLSLWMLLLKTLMGICWLWYGALIFDSILITTNIIVIVWCIMMLGLYWRNSKNVR